MRQPFPEPSAEASDAAIESEMRWVMDFILGVRRIRGELDIAPSVPLTVPPPAGVKEDLERYARHEAVIRRMAGIAGATALAPGETPPQAAAAVGDLRILVPMAGLIDVDAELARLGKRRGKVEQELARANAKLGNRASCRMQPPRSSRRNANGSRDSSVNWRNLPSSTSG